jgi:hypothetical protein
MWWVQARGLLEKEFGQGNLVPDLELYSEIEISEGFSCLILCVIGRGNTILDGITNLNAQTYLWGCVVFQ